MSSEIAVSEKGLMKAENGLIPLDKKVYGDVTLGDIKKSLIPASKKEVLLARYQRVKICDMDANEAGNELKMLINVTLLEANFKVEEIEELILKVIYDVFRDFGNMTIDEVALAYRRGVRKEYGDFMGISVVTFYSFLKNYNIHEKIEANKYLNQIKPEVEVIPPTKEELKKKHTEWLNYWIERFKEYKAAKGCIFYDNPDSMFYGYCESNGLINFTNAEKHEMYDKAKLIIKQQHHRDNANNEWDAIEFKNIVQTIEEKTYGNDINQRIIREAKRLAINSFFDGLIDKDIELKYLIDKAEKTNENFN